MQPLAKQTTSAGRTRLITQGRKPRSAEDAARIMLGMRPMAEEPVAKLFSTIRGDSRQSNGEIEGMKRKYPGLEMEAWYARHPEGKRAARELGHRNLSVEEVDELLSILTDGTKETEREMAAVALGNVGDRRATGPLCAALREDESLVVRRAAAMALGRIADVESKSALLDAMREDTREARDKVKSDIAERQSLLEALGKKEKTYINTNRLTELRKARETQARLGSEIKGLKRQDMVEKVRAEVQAKAAYALGRVMQENPETEMEIRAELQSVAESSDGHKMLVARSILEGRPTRDSAPVQKADVIPITRARQESA